MLIYQLLSWIMYHSTHKQSVQKWKYVFQRIIAHEREIKKEALDSQEIMDLLKDVGLAKIVSGIVSCYEKLVKELIVNISNECKVEESKEIRKA